MYGPQSQSGSLGGGEKIVCPAIQSQDRPVCSIVTVPTNLAFSETIKYCENFLNTFFY